MNRFKTYIPFVILLLVLIILYLPVIMELIYDWYHDDNYSHGFLIPLMSGYLVWQKKEILQKIKIQSSRSGLFILCLGLILYIVSTAGSEWFIARLSLVIVLGGILLYLAGKEIVRTIWFPIAFLVFMIPLPYVIYYALTFPMQVFSTQTASVLLELIGFPILRQGNIIHLPNYSLEVVEACSGLRSLMTLTTLGAAMAYMTQRNMWSGLLIFLFSIPIAIGANVFRIFITAIGAVMISPKFAEGFLHEVSGLIVFMIGFVSLGAVAMVIKWIAKFKDIDPVKFKTE